MTEGKLAESEKRDRRLEKEIEFAAPIEEVWKQRLQEIFKA